MPPFPRAQDRLLWGAADIVHTGTRKIKGVTMNPGSAHEFLDGDSGKERDSSWHQLLYNLCYSSSKVTQIMGGSLAVKKLP